MPPVNMEGVADFLSNPERLETIRYELKFEDVMEASLSAPTVRKRLNVGYGLGFCYLLIGIWLWISNIPIGMAIFFGLAILFPWFIRHQIRHAAKTGYLATKTAFSEPVELSYGRGELVYKTAVGFSYVTWLCQVVQTQKYRMLGLSSQSAIFVPVAVFSTPMALAEFDDIIAELAQKRVVGC